MIGNWSLTRFLRKLMACKAVYTSPEIEIPSQRLYHTGFDGSFVRSRCSDTVSLPIFGAN